MHKTTTNDENTAKQVFIARIPTRISLYYMHVALQQAIQYEYILHHTCKPIGLYVLFRLGQN